MLAQGVHEARSGCSSSRVAGKATRALESLRTCSLFGQHRPSAQHDAVGANLRSAYLLLAPMAVKTFCLSLEAVQLAARLLQFLSHAGTKVRANLKAEIQ